MMPGCHRNRWTYSSVDNGDSLDLDKPFRQSELGGTDERAGWRVREEGRSCLADDGHDPQALHPSTWPIPPGLSRHSVHGSLSAPDEHEKSSEKGSTRGR